MTEDDKKITRKLETEQPKNTSKTFKKDSIEIKS